MCNIYNRPIPQITNHKQYKSQTTNYLKQK